MLPSMLSSVLSYALPSTLPSAPHPWPSPLHSPTHDPDWLIVPTTSNQIICFQQANLHQISIFAHYLLKSLHAAGLDQLADA